MIIYLQKIFVLKNRYDVIRYKNQDGKMIVIGRQPWWHSDKSTKRNKYVFHNCYRYRAEWLDDIKFFV